MFESIITVAIVGLIAGIVFSMPVAGPISIIIVSKALEGKLRFCSRTAIGASIVETIYVFVVVFGIATLFSIYQPFIPYLLLLGSVFIIIVGIRIIRSKLDLNALDSKKIITDKMENKGGMRTGIVLNFTNPSLFIGWLMASFITLSFVSSLGFNTGGLEILLNKNVSSVSELAGPEFEQLENINNNQHSTHQQDMQDAVPPIFLALVFAFGVGFGALFWLDQLARIIVRYRDRINIKLINILINTLGFILIFIGTYLAFKAIQIFGTIA